MNVTAAFVRMAPSASAGTKSYFQEGGIAALLFFIHGLWRQEPVRITCVSKPLTKP